MTQFSVSLLFCREKASGKRYYTLSAIFPLKKKSDFDAFVKKLSKAQEKHYEARGKKVKYLGVTSLVPVDTELEDTIIIEQLELKDSNPGEFVKDSADLSLKKKPNIMGWYVAEPIFAAESHFYKCTLLLPSALLKKKKVLKDITAKLEGSRFLKHLAEKFKVDEVNLLGFADIRNVHESIYLKPYDKIKLPEKPATLKKKIISSIISQAESA